MTTRAKRQKCDNTASHTDVKFSPDSSVLIIPMDLPDLQDEYEYIKDDEDDEYDDDDDDDDDEYNPESDVYQDYIKKLNKDEKRFFKTLSYTEKKKMVDCEYNLSVLNQNSVPIRFKLLNSKHDDITKSIAINKLEMVQVQDTSNGESVKVVNWINNMCRIPVQVYKSLPVTSESDQKEITEFLENTMDHFENNIYGHHCAKKQILRILAQWIANPTSKGNVIGIHGNPGVGKTTLVKDCICKAMDLPFQFIPMGGASDGSYLDGHSYTYEGSIWGKIADSVMKAGCMNPVLYFDEIDKISDTSKGQELINILIHLTDPSQNDTFYDKYFSEFPIDLSRCLIIFTYNNDSMLNPILKDRMIRIATNDYTIEDKIHITQRFILPDFCKQFNITPGDILVSDEVVRYIVNKTQKEAGVRSLKRSFELILGNINLTRMIKKDNFDKYMINIFKYNNDTDSVFPLELTNEIVDEYIKSPPINESHHHLYM